MGSACFKEFFCFGTATALVITASIHITVWFRSFFFPFRGEQRALRMLSLYPATFLGARLLVRAPFLALNGVLNVLLYSCHTRFSVGSVWRDMEEEGGMFVAQWGGRSALSVGFSMRAPLEVHVPAVQRMALEESEGEIADIERTRKKERQLCVPTNIKRKCADRDHTQP